MSERKDFPDWVRTNKYFEQEGICANMTCLKSLEHGYNAHHSDGNPANISETNLVLLCPECHHARKYEHDKEKMKEGDTIYNMYMEHKKVERSTLKDLQEMVRKGLDKELSGAHMERISGACSQILRISRSEKGLNEVMYPPAEIKMMLSKNIAEEKMKEYIRGVEDGIKMISVTLKKEE